LDPHKKIHVEEELTKIVFLLFGCGIILYMLNPCFLMLLGSKTNSSNYNP